jgi:LPS sulfotransferase NodH
MESQGEAELTVDAAQAGNTPPDFSGNLVVLVSHERSGSHYLADMLKSTKCVTSADEVCNCRAVDPYKSPLSFFRFRQECQVRNLDFAYRADHEMSTKLLDAYFSHVVRTVGGENVLVDIKYGHVHNFEIFWWSSEQRPFLAAYLEKRDIRVVHLVRRDSVAAIVSAYIAEKTRVWHRRASDESAAPIACRVPAQKIVRDALALEREKDNFFGWLARNRCYHIEYEEFGRENDGKKAVLRGLSAFLGLDDSIGLTSAYRKVTPHLRDIVANYDELMNVVELFGQGSLFRSRSLNAD